MQFSIKKFLPHLVVLFLFVLASLLYFSPVLQGKQIWQSDIVQYTGMAKQQNDFREQTGEETFWTNSAFGGMPTYQLGARYPYSYIKKIDRTLRFLPRPADYLFLYFIGFYILMISLRVNYKLAFLGSLAFGFSTYLIIILGVGHNAKAHAIAYMPMVLAGVFLTFRKKYLAGFLVTCLAMALELNANHFQMTYYLLLLLLVIGITYLIDAYKKKLLPNFFKAVGLLALAMILSVGLNATSILATQEYATESTRGQSELTINPDGTPKESVSGLSKEYITEYSYGIVETFNLFIPRFMGGGNAEDVGLDSALYDYLLKLGASPAQASEFAASAPTYWGDQPIVAAPAYIGAVVLFLMVIALFLVKGRLKWWLVAGSILALLLSWGKNLSFLTDFFINYVPFYDKFRAVSSIQVLIELCMPILAVFGLSKLFSKDVTAEDKQKAIKYSTIILGGLALLFLLFKNSLFSFSGASDGYYIQAYGQQFIDALKEDRSALFSKDTFRSLALVLVTAVALWLFVKEKINRNKTVILLGVLIVIDLVGVDRRYVNTDDFVSVRNVKEPFQPTAADKQILKDDSHYRVYDLTTNPFSSAKASYFHNALGGYHAAKPKRIQDLFDFYLQKGDMEVLNMLNVKYILQQGEKQVEALPNPEANGPAWFVTNIQWAESANEEILAIDELDTKTTAVVHQEFKDVVEKTTFAVDSTAQIELVTVKPDYLHYETEANEAQLAVFSELYYPHGWQAYINDKPVPHFRADYALRALVVPAGYNKVEFKFEPQVVQTGSAVVITSSVLLVLIVVGSGFYFFRKKNNNTIQAP